MKLRLTLLFTLIAIATHYYLANHYYELALGMSSGEAVCNINQLFNCDAASASRYSQFLGLPIAAWGAGANTVLLFLIFGWMIGWTENLRLHSRITFYLAAAIALTSVGMLIVSAVFMGQYCLFCILAYVTSFINFELLRRSLEDKVASFGADVQWTAAKFKEAGNWKTYGLILLSAPLIALLLDKALLNQYGVKEIGQFVDLSVASWKAAPQLKLDTPPAFTKGASDADAKFVIAEFADFQCGHCKNAAPTVSAFVASRPDAQLRFYNFPLDGSCNDGLPVNGISCYLATAVTCAENINGTGSNMHDAIFKEQEAIARQPLEKTKALVRSRAQGISAEALDACTSSEEAKQQVREQAQLGRRINVRGTPTFYVNNKKLDRAQALPVLERAYQEAR